MSKRLSKREKQVLKMLLAEYSVTEISKVLDLHLNTVSGTKTRIMKKWKVTTMVGLVKEGIKQGYLELEDEQPLTRIETLRDKADPSSYLYRYFVHGD
jgi:DNA-binding CsgD family transcriptional regulator